MTKNIHQQGIRTVAGIKFPPFGVMTYQAFSGGRMRLRQSSAPTRIAKNALVRSGMKIAVPSPVIWPIKNGSGRSCRQFMEESILFRPTQVSRAQFPAKIQSVSSGAGRRLGVSRIAKRGNHRIDSMNYRRTKDEFTQLFCRAPPSLLPQESRNTKLETL